MCAPYTVIDAKTDGVYGPFDTLTQARSCSEAFPLYEIVNEAGELVDWNTQLPRPPAEPQP